MRCIIAIKGENVCTLPIVFTELSITREVVAHFENDKFDVVSHMLRLGEQEDLNADDLSLRLLPQPAQNKFQETLFLKLVWESRPCNVVVYFHLLFTCVRICSMFVSIYLTISGSC